MKNKIEDLRNHLFAQLERLADDEGMKNPIKLERELKRAKAISEVATVIVNTAKAETDYQRSVGGKPHSGFMPLDAAQPSTAPESRQLNGAKPQEQETN